MTEINPVEWMHAALDSLRLEVDGSIVDDLQKRFALALEFLNTKTKPTEEELFSSQVAHLKEEAPLYPKIYTEMVDSFFWVTTMVRFKYNGIEFERHTLVSARAPVDTTVGQHESIVKELHMKLIESAQLCIKEAIPCRYDAVVKVSGYSLATISSTGEPYIECHTCRLKSFNPNDIKEKYCSNCDKFHDDEKEFMKNKFIKR